MTTPPNPHYRHRFPAEIISHAVWDGIVLGILVQARRDGNAAKRFFQRLLKGLHYEPRVPVTDKPRSYGGLT
jgi:transposase-like protein